VCARVFAEQRAKRAKREERQRSRERRECGCVRVRMHACERKHAHAWHTHARHDRKQSIICASKKSTSPNRLSRTNIDPNLPPPPYSVCLYIPDIGVYIHARTNIRVLVAYMRRTSNQNTHRRLRRTDTHIKLCLSFHVCMLSNMCVCVRVCVRVCVHVCMYIYVYVYR
jgi:hypothetical protein